MIRKSVSPGKCAELFSLVACFIFSSSHAALNGRTNEAVIEFVPHAVNLESRSRSEILVDRFFQEAVDSDSIVFDRITGPSSRLSWARKQDLRGYESIEQFNNQGQKMFANIAADSLRTAATAALPLDLWEDRWEGWLAGLVNGAIGNTAEEHVEITSISYSAVRSSWEKSNERGGFKWGLRPWRTNPYLYFLAHAGRFENRPLFTFEGRGGYSLFGSPKLQARVTLQLPSSFRLAGGASVDPFRLAANEPGATHFGLTLERVWRSNGSVPDSVFYIGFRSGRSDSASEPQIDNQVLAGFARRW
jgi:hypothetical protein